MAPRIKFIVTLNLLWSEFAETNERRFDLLINTFIYFILKCHLSISCSKIVNLNGNIVRFHGNNQKDQTLIFQRLY